MVISDGIPPSRTQSDTNTHAKPAGAIDIKELKSAMQSLGFDAKNHTVFQMIAELDKEGEGGSLDFDEFLHMMTAKMVSACLRSRGGSSCGVTEGKTPASSFRCLTPTTTTNLRTERQGLEGGPAEGVRALRRRPVGQDHAAQPQARGQGARRADLGYVWRVAFVCVVVVCVWMLGCMDLYGIWDKAWITSRPRPPFPVRPKPTTTPSSIDQSHHTREPPHTDAELQEMIDRADADEDGEISFEEFYTIMVKRL